MADEAKPDIAPENPQPTQNTKQMPTIYNLQELIDRCFEEARKAGYLKIEILEHAGTGPQIVVDQYKLTHHIALTIIGELYELEIIRKIGPMFRMFRQIETDFQNLDHAQALDFRLRNLRRTPQEGDLT
jgi:hypothetical protein